MQIAIVGAGIIGAAIARACALAGHEVIVLEAAGVAGTGATGQSFGWINASFHADEAHFRLRQAGMEAWRRVEGVSVDWQGCLCWEHQGAALEAQGAQLEALGYPVQRLTGAQFGEMAPAIRHAPEEALFFESEGIADPTRIAQDLLAQAGAHGARVMLGVTVQAVETFAGRVTGVRTGQGLLQADRVIVAGGTGAPDLLTPLDVTLPMLRRPGVMLRTNAQPRLLDYIMVSPDLEFRQDAVGHIWAPTSAGHQGDATDVVDTSLRDLAEGAFGRLARYLDVEGLHWQQVAMAYRPVPGDGLPVIGHVGPEGLYATVMHSGITLAAVTGEIVAAEIEEGPQSNRLGDLVAPYRPQRFQM